MKNHPRSTFTRDFKIFIFIPLVILFLYTLTNEAKYLLVLLPVIILLFLIHNNIQNFHEMQEYLEVRRNFSSQRVGELNELLVILTIKNNSNFNIKMIEVVDDIPGVFQLYEGSNVFLFNLKMQEELSFSYKIISDEIGIYEFSSIHATIYETYGSIIETFDILPHSSKITVSPQLERFDKVPIFSYWMKYFNGYFVSKEMGDDSDYLGVREYMYGDTLKRINWKTTSRYYSSGSYNLFSNMYDRDKAMDVELVIDFTHESFPVYADSLKATGSLTEFFLRTRNKVGLTIAKQDPEHFRSRMSQKHLQTIIDLMLQNQPDVKKNTDLMTEKLLVLARSYKKRAVIIAVSPLINEFFISYCKQMKEKFGFTIIIIKINTYQKQLFNIASGEYEELYPLKIPLFFNVIAFDFLVKNFITKNRILAMSIPMLNWDTNIPLKGILQTYRK